MKYQSLAAQWISELQDIVHCLDITLGGRPAVGLASSLRLPAACGFVTPNDT
jgi:hypothetical protein